MGKTVCISIVSHNQQDLIKENFAHFPKMIGEYQVKFFIADNTGSETLKKFCYDEGFFYFYSGHRKGFGANHNKAYKILNLFSGDIFIICNPDIVIDPPQLEGILKSFEHSNSDIFNVTVYFDEKKEVQDNPDKHYPYFFNFVFSILTGKRLHYGSNKNVKHPAWISGAFMVVKPEAFKQLGGFDEGYFMYCEDLDLCFQAKKMGMTITYDAGHYILHDTRMDSRKLFSKSIWWHMKSALRYLWKNRQFKLIYIAK